MMGRRIAALRRDAGLSQAELAGRLQISPSAVGMYEQGRREPSAEMLVALAELFCVSTDYLLTGKPAGDRDLRKLEQVLEDCAARAGQRLEARQEAPFTAKELLILFAALLSEP